MLLLRLEGCICRLRSIPRRSASSPRASSQSRSIHHPTASNSATPTRKGKEVDRWPGWIPTVGLELHVQLRGNIKLLSPALAGYEAQPNSQVAFLDSALPGALPKLNPEAVRLALLACLALKSNINASSTFDRKHYFYPDLPAGYQVTQKYSPLASGGSIGVRRGTPASSFEVRIDQIQLEQDTAKSSHDPDSGLTLVDLNRAGAALIEIVTQPDMKTAEEAVAFVRHLQSLLRHIGASDANMERGELRCDVNVSVRRAIEGATLGTRCEVKNLNGLRFLVGAIESEIGRQISDITNGIPVVQATRGFDPVAGETFHLRSKEDAPDYRYMPDPELGTVSVSQSQIASLLNLLPELPEAAYIRLQSQYHLTPQDASILVALGEGLEDSVEGHMGAGLGVSYFEEVAKGREGKLAANWVIHELLGQLTKVDLSLAASPITAAHLGELIDAVSTGMITGTNAKSILRTFLLSPSTVSLSSLLSSQITCTLSTPALQDICKVVIADLATEAEKVRQGQGKVLMRLVGEVMRRSGGKADAKKVAEVLREMLKLS